MSHTRYFNYVPLLLLVFGCFAFPGRTQASSCVTCHTDEDLLRDNLAETQTVKSALQAGSG